MLDYKKLSADFDRLLESYTASELIAHIEKIKDNSQDNNFCEDTYTQNVSIDIQRPDYVYSNLQGYFEGNSNSINDLGLAA